MQNLIDFIDLFFIVESYIMLEQTWMSKTTKVNTAQILIFYAHVQRTMYSKIYECAWTRICLNLYSPSEFVIIISNPNIKLAF